MYVRLLQFVLLLVICSAHYGYAQSNYVGHSLLKAYKSVLNAEVNGIIKREGQNEQDRNNFYSAIDKQAPINKNITNKQGLEGRVAKLRDLPLENRNTIVGPARNKQLQKVGWENF